jgi:hypothetical protein
MVKQNPTVAIGQLFTALSICCITLTTPAQPALETELAGHITHRHSTYQAQSIASELELTPWLKWNQNDQIRWLLSARIRGDAQDLFLPGEPDFGSYSSGSRPYTTDRYFTFELRDAYFELDVANSQIRLGKQQIVWGALDGIKVIDVLNPQSFEHFILEDFADSRIGLWSAYLDTTFAGWRAELALIPDISVHFIPNPGAQFAFTASKFQFGNTNPNSQISQVSLDPQDKEGTAGLRLSRYVAGIDIQLVAVTGLDFEPYGELINDPGSPTGIALATSHARREVYGFAAQGSLGPIVLRMEAAFIDGRRFNTRNATNLDTHTLDQWRGALGIDINGPLDTFINIQYLYDKVSNAPDDLVRPETEQVLTSFIRRTFAYERIKYELRIYTSLQDNDTLISNKLEYQLNDNMLVALSFDNFDGTTQGTFGQFDRNDQVSISWQWTL